MRKKDLNHILKMVKKQKRLDIPFEPTIEEADYLQSKGVNVSLRQLTLPSIIDYTRRYLRTYTSLEVSND